MPNAFRSQPDEHVVQRVRAEFLEMPGLRLTCLQAKRLFGLDNETCSTLLNTLVDLEFLSRGSDGCYGRLTEGRLPTRARQMAKADVRPHDETTPVRRHPAIEPAV
jgi:hypothetical protein